MSGLLALYTSDPDVQHQVQHRPGAGFEAKTNGLGDSTSNQCPTLTSFLRGSEPDAELFFSPWRAATLSHLYVDA